MDPKASFFLSACGKAQPPKHGFNPFLTQILRNDLIHATLPLQHTSMSEFYNQVWKPIFENGSLFVQPHFPPVSLVPQASRLLLLLCTLLALTTRIPPTHHILCRRYRPQCHCQKPRTSLCTPGWRRSIAQISSFHIYVGAICHYRVEHHIALPRLPPLTQRNRRSHFAFC